ncbi:MAG: class I SAM-dependent methyltransferase [Bacteroidota bacterium]
MNINLQDIASNIYQASDGIWYSNNTSPISYPEDGNHTLNILQQNSFWFQHRNRFLHEVMLKFAPQTPFFDIGGGTGFVSKMVQEKIGEVVLVEPQADGYLQAQKYGIQHMIASTTIDAQFKENVLDSAGMFDVVEHIEDDYGFMRSIHNYLKPNARIYITVPAIPFLWSDEDIEAGHYRRYTKETLQKLLKETGFEIDYCSYFFSFLYLPLFLFRSLPSKLGIKRAVSDLNKLKKEHTNRQGMSNHILQWFMQRELNSIQRGKTINYGTSLVIVGRKR